MPHMFTNAEYAVCLRLLLWAVPLLLLKNTADGFLCAEFRIVECFRRCSIHCVNAVRFPLLMFHLNGQVNKTWRNRRHILDMVQRSPTTNTRRLSTRLRVSRTRLWRTLHEDGCTHFTHSLCKIYTKGTVPCV